MKGESVMSEWKEFLNEQLKDPEFRAEYEAARLVLAWDPDFTKVTPTEAAALRQAEEEFERGEFVRAEDIDWK
jgi:alkyl hydroperoxide reductase subunit AhpC